MKLKESIHPKQLSKNAWAYVYPHRIEILVQGNSGEVITTKIHLSTLKKWFVNAEKANG